MLIIKEWSNKKLHKMTLNPIIYDTSEIKHASHV